MNSDRAAAGEAEPDLDAYIAHIVAQAPPLSGGQRDKLALILTASTSDEDTQPRPSAADAGVLLGAGLLTS